MLRSLREAVLNTAKKLVEYELVVMAGGTVCARDPDTGNICITPSGMEYDNMTWEDIVIIDENVSIIEARRKISVASKMFAEILKSRQDIHSVIHTHSIYATAYSCVGKEIPCVTTTQGNLVGGGVPVVKGLELGPYDERFYRRIVETLKGKRAVNLFAHGPIAVGENLEKCLEVAVTVEVTAKIADIANRLGEPIVLTAEQANHAYSFCSQVVGQN